jgi:heme exporter protein D
MDTIYNFFHMGGYAFYVWTSYGLALIILLVSLLVPLNNERTLLRTLARKAKRKQHDNTDFNS